MSNSKLARYCRDRRGEIARLAKAAKITPEQMGRIVSGQRGASLSAAVAIADATNGLITPADVAAAFDSTTRREKTTRSTARPVRRITRGRG